MQVKGIKIGLVIIVALFVLGSLLFAQYMWEVQGVYRPLLQSVKTIEGVKTVVVDKEKGGLIVKVELGSVNNFALTYKEIFKSVSSSLTKNRYRIEIMDNRNDMLTLAYLSISSYVQEGIQTGKYSLMEEQINKQAKSLGLDYHYVIVDEDNIYLQLHMKDSYLYEVITRNKKIDN